MLFYIVEPLEATTTLEVQRPLEKIGFQQRLFFK